MRLLQEMNRVLRTGEHSLTLWNQWYGLLREEFFVALTIPLQIEFFIDDYDNAVVASDALDEKLKNVANSVLRSPSYSDLISLNLRQILGAADITVKSNNQNGWNTSDIKIFVKDLGRVGVGGYVILCSYACSILGIDSYKMEMIRTSSVDILYASFPAYLYLNATWARYLLTPLLEYQDSPLYSDVSAIDGFGKWLELYIYTCLTSLI